jgi:hypothetical protein
VINEVEHRIIGGDPFFGLTRAQKKAELLSSTKKLSFSLYNAAKSIAFGVLCERGARIACLDILFSDRYNVLISVRNIGLPHDRKKERVDALRACF